MTEDLSPSYVKLGLLPNGFIIHNVSGIRTQIVQRLDGRGYDIRRCESSFLKLKPNLLSLF